MRKLGHVMSLFLAMLLVICSSAGFSVKAYAAEGDNADEVLTVLSDNDDTISDGIDTDVAEGDTEADTDETDDNSETVSEEAGGNDENELNTETEEPSGDEEKETVEYRKMSASFYYVKKGVTIKNESNGNTIVGNDSSKFVTMMGLGDKYASVEELLTIVDEMVTNGEILPSETIKTIERLSSSTGVADFNYDGSYLSIAEQIGTNFGAYEGSPVALETTVEDLFDAGSLSRIFSVREEVDAEGKATGNVIFLTGNSIDWYVLKDTSNGRLNGWHADGVLLTDCEQTFVLTVNRPVVEPEPEPEPEVTPETPVIVPSVPAAIPNEPIAEPEPEPEPVVVTEPEPEPEPIVIMPEEITETVEPIPENVEITDEETPLAEEIPIEETQVPAVESDPVPDIIITDEETPLGFPIVDSRVRVTIFIMGVAFATYISGSAISGALKALFRKH